MRHFRDFLWSTAPLHSLDPSRTHIRQAIRLASSGVFSGRFYLKGKQGAYAVACNIASRVARECDVATCEQETCTVFSVRPVDPPCKGPEIYRAVY